MNKKNTLVIKGNVTSSFIQQDASNSTQNGNFNFDYDAAERLFKSIDKVASYRRIWQRIWERKKRSA